MKPSEWPEEFYSPGQLEKVYDCLGDRVPGWLLLGGPASANEAQTAVQKWPGIRVVGVDPNPDVVLWQRTHGWPEDAPLVYSALWHHLGYVAVGDPGGGLLHRFVHPGGKKLDSPQVPATTWDILDATYGPFGDALMWLDIEGSELEALRGAVGLLDRRAVMRINVELITRDDGGLSLRRIEEVHSLLTGYGFVHVLTWNDSESCRDRVYLLQEV